jgi:hypothetical protein
MRAALVATDSCLWRPNRPTNVKFGPDGRAYVVDYGVVRDNGADTHFVGANNGPLLQIPGTGVIFKICKQ